jgi:hypothetical protein
VVSPEEALRLSTADLVAEPEDEDEEKAKHPRA